MSSLLRDGSELRTGGLAGERSVAVLVIEAAMRMRRTGLTVSSLGNVSMRVGGEIWMTPTRVLAWHLRPEGLAVVGRDGSHLGGGKPSREAPLHLELYRRFTWVRAIVHTHSPWATAWSYLGRDLDLASEEMSYHGLRRIRCSAPAPSGSTALGRAAAEVLGQARVALLHRHGTVAMADTPTQALELCAVAEQQAQLQWLLHGDSE